jgi:hypothetical protein
MASANELVAIIKNTQQRIAECEARLEDTIFWLNSKQTEASRNLSQYDYKPVPMPKYARNLTEAIERYSKELYKTQEKLIKMNL